MDINCNATTLEAQTQINSTIFSLVNMVSMCVSCSLNTVLGVPLLLVIVRPPSPLRHTRFLLLTHPLLYDNLQVDLLLSSYLFPGSMHGDALYIATTITYNLGMPLIPLVYGYRSRELQQRKYTS